MLFRSCGGEAHFGAIEDHGPQHDGRYIECSKCGASSMLVFAHKGDVDRELVESWNRRSARSASASSACGCFRAEPCRPSRDAAGPTPRGRDAGSARPRRASHSPGSYRSPGARGKGVHTGFQCEDTISGFVQNLYEQCYREHFILKHSSQV